MKFKGLKHELDNNTTTTNSSSNDAVVNRDRCMTDSEMWSDTILNSNTMTPSYSATATIFDTSPHHMSSSNTSNTSSSLPPINTIIDKQDLKRIQAIVQNMKLSHMQRLINK